MAKFLFNASYTKEGSAGLLKDGGTKRREVVREMVAGLGGTVDAFYFAFGDTDVVIIADLPDAASAAALSLAVGSSGSVRLTTTPLITPEEIDNAAKKTVAYRAPGR